MDWLVGVAGAALDWVLAVVGAILKWSFDQGLAGWGAAATGVAAILAYLQYRDKRYGLSDGEWDILKALQKYRLINPSVAVVCLDDDSFHRVLYKYLKTAYLLARSNTDMLLHAWELGESHARSFPPVFGVENLIVSPVYTKYCRSLKDREYLSRISAENGVEKYDLTPDGEHFMEKKRKRIEKRDFRGNFLDGVEIVKWDTESRHRLEPGAVEPDFMGYSPSIVDGWEFPDSAFNRDNPCGVWCMLRSYRHEADVDRISNMVGHDVRLKIKGPTVNLLPDNEHGMDASLRYCHVGEVVVDMWFGDPQGETTYFSPDSLPPTIEESRKAVQKKIEETYYRNGDLNLPQSYKEREVAERRDYEYTQARQRLYRDLPLQSRCRYRVSEAWSRLWSRLKRLAKRDEAD